MMGARYLLFTWRELDLVIFLVLTRNKYYLEENRVQRLLGFKEAGLSLPSLKKAQIEKREYS